MIGAIVAGLYGAPTPPVTNSWESIATTIVGSGGTPTITFNTIPSTFKHLQIRAISKITTSTAYPQMRFNGDTGANYSAHILYGTGSGSAQAYALPNQTYMEWVGGEGSAAQFQAAVIDILDYTNTSKNKTVRSLTGVDENGAGQVKLASGLWYATPAAINSITISLTSNAFAQYSSFALYGIKG